jgi:hypothetical protein
MEFEERTSFEIKTIFFMVCILALFTAIGFNIVINRIENYEKELSIMRGRLQKNR